MADNRVDFFLVDQTVGDRDGFFNNPIMVGV